MKKYFFSALTAVLFISIQALFSTPAFSQSDVDQLAKQVANPVANLISVPCQFNYDRKIGPADDGKRYTINVQPVIPFKINNDWNLITANRYGGCLFLNHLAELPGHGTLYARDRVTIFFAKNEMMRIES